MSVNEAMELVSGMLEGGDAYLDWGAVDDCNTNVSCKYIADEVGRAFKDRGYFVYNQLMGFGSKRIHQGTPVCIRICKEPREQSSTLVEF